MLEQICAPALLYVGFSLTQIIIDIFKNLYNTAFLKFIVMIIFTIMLNLLCERGLGIISWFIVFIPFIMMTIITTLLLFVFGLSPSTGSLKYNVTDYPSQRELSQQPQSIVQTYPSQQSYPSAHPYPQQYNGASPTPTPTPTPAPTPTPTQRHSGVPPISTFNKFMEEKKKVEEGFYSPIIHQTVEPPILVNPVSKLPPNI